LDCDPKARVQSEPSLLIDWPVEEQAPRRVAFIRNENAAPKSLQDLCAVEATARAREEINSLYVAMSRAREWLVFSRTEPHQRGAARSWWTRVAELHNVSEAWSPSELDGVEAASANAAPNAMPTTTPPAAVPVLPGLRWRPSTKAPTTANITQNADAAKLGQAVHRVLEWAGRPGAPLPRADWPAACEAAATSFGLPEGAGPRVHQLVTRIFDSPACARFFSGPGLLWAGNEVPVAGLGAGEPSRIDRLVQLLDAEEATATGGPSRHTWWVLDYKLNHAPAEIAGYQAQMRAYVAAVQALQPADRVQGAFITGAGQVVEL
jgi:ATP-dependent helicase/nuclease subunit A